jgi:hypothetical protein
LHIYTTSDYGTTWAVLNAAVYLEDATGGVLVPYPDATARYLFAGNYVNGVADNPTLVDDDTNNLIRIDTTDLSMTNISPVVATESYGPVYVSGVNAPRGAFETPTGNKNILFMIGSEFATDKVGVFYTMNALAVSPSWVTLIDPGVSTPYRKLVLDDNPRELYLFGTDGNIAYTDTPTNGASIDDRTGDLSTSAEIISIAGWVS